MAIWFDLPERRKVKEEQVALYITLRDERYEKVGENESEKRAEELLTRIQALHSKSG